MPILPLIFDTTLGLGAIKLRDTFLYPFLHLRGCFEAPAAIVKFSSFCAGKLRRHAKIECVVVRLCVGASPAKKGFNIYLIIKHGGETRTRAVGQTTLVARAR